MMAAVEATWSALRRAYRDALSLETPTDIVRIDRYAFYERAQKRCDRYHR